MAIARQAWAGIAVLVAGTLAGTPGAEAQQSAPGAAPGSFAQPTVLPGFSYDVPFFPGAKYDANVPTPDSVLGYRVGDKPATHAQIEAVLHAIAAKSPRVKLFEYATSHEGRKLYYLVISSEANIKRLEALKADIGRFADPRRVSKDEGDKLAAALPAVAWMAYVIHGDEMSGSDASLALAHHLAACTDEPVKKMLDELVVIIDPLMNPDGRDRCLKMVAENRTRQPSVDDQSVIHSLYWPSGRMNHYLFDMNRDWIFGTQPETRGRIAAAGPWHPQLFLESHEMGSQDTFLFSPPREPVNPNMPAAVVKWWEVFGSDIAAAFDSHGWRYYTGEWNEEWYPGYSGSWAGFRGAIDFLYEQAAITTDGVRKQEGTIETYREAVHHQLVASLANLTSLRKNRAAVMKDYLAERRAAVAEGGPVVPRTFAVVPGHNAARVDEFVDLMQLQGFEVLTAGKEFIASGKDRLGVEIKDRKFPAGTLLVATRQPEGRLLTAMLEFDPRMKPEFLADERRELLRFGQSKLYDITGWNTTMMFDLEGYELAGDLPAGAEKLPAHGAPKPGAVEKTTAPVGFVVDGADDRSVALAGRLMERGVKVRCASKPFNLDGRDYPRGSVLVLRKDNLNFTGDLNKAVAEVAAEASVNATGLGSGLGAGDLPDLGGQYFVLLEAPRIAVVGREPFSPYSYGEVWYLLDHVMGLRASYLNASQLSYADLRRYNVLVIPDGGLEAVKDKDGLKAWVKGGGTLIAIGSSAKDIASESLGLSGVRVLPDVLTKLDDFALAVVREWEGRNVTPDPAQVWTFSTPQDVKFPWVAGGAGKADKPADDEIKRRDQWKQIFMPSGAILAARVDDRAWLTGGCGEYLPVVYSGDTVLMASGAVQAPVRMGVFAPAPPEVKKEDKDKKTDGGKGEAKADAKAADDAKAKDINTKDTKEEKGAKRGKDGESDQAKGESKEKKDADKDDDEKPVRKAGFALLPEGQEMRLRMSGLLWPEAADRIANSAYLTRESVGAGQVILFASSPTFRGAAKGTMRILSNAMVLGRGWGPVRRSGRKRPRMNADWRRSEGAERLERFGR